METGVGSLRESKRPACRGTINPSFSWDETRLATDYRMLVWKRITLIKPESRGRIK